MKTQFGNTSSSSQVEMPLEEESPSEKVKWGLVEETMRRYGHEPSALIEVLHTVQETFGYMERDVLRHVANSLRVPLSKVYGVATFYHFFTLKPPGEHTCEVCTGTACHIEGAPDILAAIEDNIGVRPGETSTDEEVSLFQVRCLGPCELAPVVVFEGEAVGKISPTEVVERIRRWRNHDT